MQVQTGLLTAAMNGDVVTLQRLGDQARNAVPSICNKVTTTYNHHHTVQVAKCAHIISKRLVGRVITLPVQVSATVAAWLQMVCIR